MRPEEYEFMYELEEKFWWYVGMRQITDAVVEKQLKNGASRQILDAGCGTGFNLGHFASLGPHNVFGLDLSADALAGVRKRGLSKVCQASIAEIPYATNSFDLVFTFDVLCQVDPPIAQASLNEMQRVLRPGGFLFIRVPAFAWMRSSHDDAVESKRRFARHELEGEVKKAGLKIEWSSYANCFLFPAVILRRMMKSVGIGHGSDVRPLPGAIGWIDPIFRRALASEASLFRSRRQLPFGLSLVCLAQKL